MAAGTDLADASLQLLHTAASYGQDHVASFLLTTCRADPNAGGDRGAAPLVFTSLEDSVKVAERLIQAGALIDHQNFEGKKALHSAASYNALEVGKLLLRKDPAAVNDQDHAGFSPLMVATYFNRVGFMRLLLHYKANVNAVAVGGWIPLHFAVHFEHVEAVELLLRHGANVNTNNVPLHTPLNIAMMTRNQEILELLLRHEAIIGPSDGDIPSPLQVAVFSGDLGILKVLLRYGADPTLEDFDSFGLLSIASKRNPEAVLELLEYGLCVHGVPDDEHPPICVAAEGGRIDIASILVKYGANVNTVGAKDHRTPYCFARQNGHKDMMRFLVENGATVPDDCHSDTEMETRGDAKDTSQSAMEIDT